MVIPGIINRNRGGDNRYNKQKQRWGYQVNLLSSKQLQRRTQGEDILRIFKNFRNVLFTFVEKPLPQFSKF